MKRSTLILAVSTAVAALAAGLSTAPAATQPTVKTAASPLGRILVDSRGRTLYLFEKDRPGTSVCTGACAAYWPPLLASGKPAAGAGLKRGQLGTTRRSDGRTQVTYAGHPLYRFVSDTRPGQRNGQGLNLYGGGWYVVSPAGKKIETGGS